MTRAAEPPRRGRLARLAGRARDTTLGTRLVALLVALITLVFLMVAAATALALHTFLLDRLDQQLAAAGDRYSVTLEHPADADDDDSGRFRTLSGQAAGTLGARVVAGVVTAAGIVGRPAGDRAVAPGSPARSALARVPVTSAPRSVHLPGLGEYRVVVTRGLDGDLLITGLPTEPIDSTIARLIAIEAVAFAAALAVTVPGAVVFVRIALRPLNRMAETATDVAALPLETGTVSLPDRGPRTASRTEVGIVANAFDRMLEHVESSLRRRQQSEDRLRRFIADASHELRTPVAVVRSHAEYARRTAGELPPSVVTSLGRIAAESERMGHLVDDLLLLARLDSGRPLAREEVDISRLVLDAVADAQVAGRDHVWTLDLPEEPVSVVGDEDAIRQVLANLLANARTHTPAGTTVQARVLDLPDESAVEVEVADDGPGIPAHVVADVFERFVRGDDSRSHTTGSSGLGLSIVHAIVQALGGSITVDSRPGSTSFMIRMVRAEG